MQHASAYDEILTDVYESHAVPLIFSAPARDLVAATGVRAGDIVLDIGTGTGAAARIAATITGDMGRVVGFDASRAMLSAHPSDRLYDLILGSVPYLPFKNSSFDIVMANFVIGHFKDHKGALAAMADLVTAGGRVGVSAWAEGNPTLVSLWDRLASEVVNSDELMAQALQTIPCGDYFACPEHLRLALQDAGLTKIQVSPSSHMVRCTPEQYIHLRSIARKGTLIRQALGSDQWDRFLSAAIVAFRAEFGERIEYSSDAIVAVGTR